MRVTKFMYIYLLIEACYHVSLATFEVYETYQWHETLLPFSENKLMLLILIMTFIGFEVDINMTVIFITFFRTQTKQIKE